MIRQVRLGACGAAMVMMAAVSTAQAQLPDASPSACEIYARQYADTTTRLHPAIWQCAYHHAHQRCLSAGPSFITIPSVDDCVVENCEPLYTLCMCAGQPATWKRRVGLGC